MKKKVVKKVKIEVKTCDVCGKEGNTTEHVLGYDTHYECLEDLILKNKK